MNDASQLAAAPPGWLRSRNFDLTLIRSVALAALAAGLVVTARPDLFMLVLLVNLWLLGYHHVIATFTRLAFDRQSLRENRFFVFYLPPIVFAATFAIAYGIGVWVIATVYLYWQWFHYTRQSWGISQVYRRKSNGLVTDGPVLSWAAAYLLPLYGILYRSWQDPGQFLFEELRVIPVPELLVDLVGVAALAAIALWSWKRFVAWRAGQLPLAQTWYMISHFVIFFVGYRVIDDITAGWLVISVWHNAQYLLFVWLFNTNRFRKGPEESAPFLSRLCQPDNKLRYFMTCFGVSTVLYIAFAFAGQTKLAAGLPLAVIFYQAINFHHYIVDSLIWKARKKPMQETLGLSKT